MNNASLVNTVEKEVSDMTMEKVVQTKVVNKKGGNTTVGEEGGGGCGSFDEKVESTVIRGLKRKRGELYDSVKLLVERLVEKRMK